MRRLLWVAASALTAIAAWTAISRSPEEPPSQNPASPGADSGPRLPALRSVPTRPENDTHAHDADIHQTLEAFRGNPTKLLAYVRDQSRGLPAHRAYVGSDDQEAVRRILEALVVALPDETLVALTLSLDDDAATRLLLESIAGDPEAWEIDPLRSSLLARAIRESERLVGWPALLLAFDTVSIPAATIVAHELLPQITNAGKTPRTQTLAWFEKHQESIGAGLRQAVAQQALRLLSDGTCCPEIVRIAAWDTEANPRETVERFLFCLRYGDPLTREAVVTCLAEHVPAIDRSVVAQVFAVSADRAYAIDAFTTADSAADLLDLVRPFVRDGDPRVQLAAVHALTRAGSATDDFIPILEASCRDGGPRRLRAFEVLALWPGRVHGIEAHLTDAIANGSSIEACLAFLVACRQGEARAVEWLPAIEQWVRGGVVTAAADAVRRGVEELIQRQEIASVADLPEGVRRLVEAGR